MVKTKGFWGLWLGFVIGTLAGLMAIGISSPVGQEVFKLSAATAAALTGVFAIFNGIGRPIFGYLVDRINPRNTAMLSFGIIFLAAAFLGFGAAPGATALYIAGFAALWLCLGGWLAIAPACHGSLLWHKVLWTKLWVSFHSVWCWSYNWKFACGKVARYRGQLRCGVLSCCDTRGNRNSDGISSYLSSNNETKMNYYLEMGLLCPSLKIYFIFITKRLIFHFTF